MSSGKLKQMQIAPDTFITSKCHLHFFKHTKGSKCTSRSWGAFFIPFSWVMLQSSLKQRDRFFSSWHSSASTCPFGFQLDAINEPWESLSMPQCSRAFYTLFRGCMYASFKSKSPWVCILSFKFSLNLSHFLRAFHAHTVFSKDTLSWAQAWISSVTLMFKAKSWYNSLNVS